MASGSECRSSTTGASASAPGRWAATKKLLDLSIDHVKERRQFGQPLADFELVQDKIGWMVSNLFALESMCYLTCGLVDAGVEDYSLESAICKVSGTEFLWYTANRAMQLKGGAGYMKDEPYEKVLRDIRIFPIFEGANDVMRAFVALSGMKPVGEKLSELGEIGLGDPIGSIGVLAEYVGRRIQRQVRPERITKAHPELGTHAESVSEQVQELRDVSESLLREHRKDVMHRQFQQKRIYAAISDIFAQVAVLSRVTQIFEDQGVEPSGQERFIADTFCSRAARRVQASFRQIESNDDERMWPSPSSPTSAANTATPCSRTERAAANLRLTLACRAGPPGVVWGGTGRRPRKEPHARCDATAEDLRPGLADVGRRDLDVLRLEGDHDQVRRRVPV